MRSTVALAALLTLLAPASVAAQPTAAPASASVLSERMTPLSWLVGEWRGSGWTLTPDGTRHRFESVETVTPRLSGNALLVEGRHHEPGHPTRIVHDALAMLTWDARANAYRFRTALANGMAGDYPIEVSPTGFRWRIDTPGGPITYLAELRDGAWIERGQRQGPNGQPVDFFEMILRRVR